MKIYRKTFEKDEICTPTFVMEPENPIGYAVISHGYGGCKEEQLGLAARIAEAEFISESIHMIYLLNKKYMPFYKWMHKDMQFLPILGKEVHNILDKLISVQNSKKPETTE